jgi:hypothetical protein
MAAGSIRMLTRSSASRPALWLASDDGESAESVATPRRVERYVQPKDARLREAAQLAQVIRRKHQRRTWLGALQMLLWI